MTKNNIKKLLNSRFTMQIQCKIIFSRKCDCACLNKTGFSEWLVYIWYLQLLRAFISFLWCSKWLVSQKKQLHFILQCPCYIYILHVLSVEITDNYA